MQHRLAHRVGHSSQATPAAVDKSQSASYTEFLTLPAIDEATVVAFRGTRPLVLRDDINDFQQAFGLDSRQYDQAQVFAQKIYDQNGGNVIFTGHSLGGGEAAAAAYYTGADAVTFNAAGLNARYQPSMWLGPVNSPGNVTNFQIIGDPLSTAQHFFPVPGAVGTQIMLPAQQFERHSIRNFWY